MIGHRKLVTILATGLASLAGAVAHAETIFDDNFDANIGFTPVLGYVPVNEIDSAAHWTVGPSGGNVDFLNEGGVFAGPGGFNLCQGTGSCVDLDGTATANGAFMYTDVSLKQGQTYTFTATVTGNNRIDSDDWLHFGFAGADDSLTALDATSVDTQFVDNDAGISTFSVTFQAVADTVGRVFFQNWSNFDGVGTSDQNGIVLLNASLTAVPLPAAAWLLLSGLAGVGVIARRRRSGGMPAVAA